jgi:ABC-type polysaccharide/polyol phosphate export permease
VETFDQHSCVAGVVVAPLALLAGVFYSARTLPEPWETVTRLNPIYYVVDSTRVALRASMSPRFGHRARSLLPSVSARFCSRPHCSLEAGV